MKKENYSEVLSIDGHEVTVTHPDKLYFSAQTKLSKLGLVRYYLSVAPGAIRGIRDRPLVLKRYVNGAEGEAFYQKRAPEQRPPWLRTVTLSFPSGRKAEEIVVDDAAGLTWVVNLGCIELHPHAVRSSDLDHPDELRVDLDPGPGVSWDDVRRVALEVKSFLEEMGLRGWPKTSGSRGMHVNVRIKQRWTFVEVRRAALALSRAIERRVPTLASSKWWKEERHGVFLDYNQNAKDRTTCSAYSVRPVPDARVSTPLLWSEVPDCDPADFTVLTVPRRFKELGDPDAVIDDEPGSLEKLLELSAKDEAAGLGDAPWPPHFRKMKGEATRVNPSRARPSTKSATKKRSKQGDSPARKAAKKVVTRRPARQRAEAQQPSSSKSGKEKSGPGRRRSTMPLLVIAQARKKEAALAGLEKWKIRHPEAAKFLEVEDVLIDSMRGRSSTWTRIRVNLRHVPEELRPPQETPDPDYDPATEWSNQTVTKRRQGTRRR